MGFEVQDERIKMDIPAFHAQVLPYFPQYNPRLCSPDIILDYRDTRNVVGHQQRAFICYYALKAFDEHLIIGLDAGSAGVVTPMCISLDIIGNGEVPTYGGIMSGVHIKADAADLSMFQNESFSCVVFNHTIEHICCDKLKGGETSQEKINLHCPGTELLDIFRLHWLRVLRKGGYFCAVIPDDEPAHESKSSVFLQDSSHQHAWTANEFYHTLIVPLLSEGLVEVVEHNVWENHFSFGTVLRKR